MEEEIKEMAGGQPELPQFSGMVIPEGIKLTAVPAENLDIPKVSGPPKPPELVKLHPADMKKLGRLVQDEEVAVEAAKKAARRRDLFCVDMEKEYSLIGKSWKVNFKTGMIEVLGDRN